MVALDEILDELNKKAVERLVCLGDAAATGPRPREVLARLRSLKVPIVMGNRDEFLVDAESPKKVATGSQSDYSNKVREIDSWCRKRLDSSDLQYIRNFPRTLSFPLAAGTETSYIFCFHGSAKSNTDLITSTTSESELLIKLDGHSEHIMAGGHSHIQMFRRFNGSVIINPGSVGQAIESNAGQTHCVSWAEYATVKLDEGGALQNVELSRVKLSAAGVLSDAIDSGMPHAKWWAGR